MKIIHYYSKLFTGVLRARTPLLLRSVRVLLRLVLVEPLQVLQHGFGERQAPHAGPAASVHQRQQAEVREQGDGAALPRAERVNLVGRWRVRLRRRPRSEVNNSQ